VDGLSITNPVGRLVKASTSNTRTVNSYDLMGRIATKWQCTPQNCGSGWYTLAYGYDLASNITSFTDGAGHTFTQTFNAAARLTQLTSSLNDAQHPGTLASGLTYNAAGALIAMTLGNGLAESRSYNNRMQPVEMRTYNPSTQADTLKLTYGFDADPGAGVINSGNVMSWVATGAQNFSRSYTYDELNRLKTMAAPGDPCSGLSWTYDIWGNRTHQTPTGGTCNQSQLTINTLNRIADTGFGYDAAGNLIAEPGKTYQWDAEGRLISINNGSVGSYVYDANGRRVRKTASGTTTEYVYDLAGSVAAEFQGTTWTKGYVYLGGLLAQYSDGTTYFAHKDHLGSTRVLTKPDKSFNPTDAYDYLPFGESTSTGSTSHKFTGQERDTESGLDYMTTRFHSSMQGRFTSADPLQPDSSHPNILLQFLTNPQNWNKYAYSRNNPVNNSDRSGTYSKGDHQQLQVNAMLARGYSRKAALISARANTRQDTTLSWVTVIPKIGRLFSFGDNPTHGMRNEGQSRHGAAVETESFITSEIRHGALNALAGNVKEALENLGRASHAAQDVVAHGFMSSQEHSQLNANLKDALGGPEGFAAGDVTTQLIDRLEQQIYEFGRQQGLSDDQIAFVIADLRAGETTSNKPSQPQD
jgi:RHS repeat-associated protein